MTIQIILDTLKRATITSGATAERTLIMTMLEDVNTTPTNTPKHAILSTEEGSWTVDELNKIIREHKEFDVLVHDLHGVIDSVGVSRFGGHILNRVAVVCQEINRLRKAQPDTITPGKNAELGETHRLRKELCNHILAELAGQGFPTPEETYGADIGWAVADMSKALAEAMQHAKIHDTTDNEKRLTAERDAALKLATGWRIPKRGDKVRLVKQPNPTLYGFDWLKVGDVVEVECLAGCCTGEPMPEGADGWKQTSTAGIFFKKPNGEPSETTVLPLDCFEPVNETTAQEAK